MLVFLPRSLCALKRCAAKFEHARYGATTGIHIWSAGGIYRAEATDGRRAIVAHGYLVGDQDASKNWPGCKETPDDAFETIVSPKDLDRASKLGGDWLASPCGIFLGLATDGNNVLLGLGQDVINAPRVEGRFPQIDQVVPKQPPLFSVRVDPKLLAETLLTIAELAPEAHVQVFYFSKEHVLGLCAQGENMLIDALVVPLTAPAAPAPAEEAAAEDEPEEVEEEAQENAEEPVEQAAEPEAPADQEEQPVEQVGARKPRRRRARKTANA